MSEYVYACVPTNTLTGGHRDPAAPSWEGRTVYQPFLVENEGKFYDFYNAGSVVVVMVMVLVMMMVVVV